MDRDIVLEALSALCNANVTSVQKQGPHGGSSTGAEQHQMLLRALVSTVLDADETSFASRSNFDQMRAFLLGYDLATRFSILNLQTADIPTVSTTAKYHPSIIIDEEEFFDKSYDYDFTNLKDTQTFYRGGEMYERPCGWYRLGLRVLNKYGDNTWLGNQCRSTQSVPGEWPVSYHGTSKKGAEGIIEGYYKPGPRQQFGRGVYSTPFISEAVKYANTFTSKKNGKKYQVILQNRVNPKFRQKHNNDKYWLVPIPAGVSDGEERKKVDEAIRPYGLLIRQV